MQFNCNRLEWKFCVKISSGIDYADDFLLTKTTNERYDEKRNETKWEKMKEKNK